MTDSNSQYRKRNPDKAKAHTAVAGAVRRGKLTPAAACECCGVPAKVHGHHEDYSKPLEVVWLCTQCHENIHHPVHVTPKKPERKRKPTYKPRHAKFYPAPKRDALIENARALRSTGLSYEKIGKQIGVSIGTVYKWLNDTQYN